MSISNYLEEKILNKVFRNVDFTVSSVKVSLHTADPGETGANEVTGGTYTQQTAAFDAAVNPAGTNQNTSVINFTLMPVCVVTHVGVWDSSGNFLWGGALSSPRTVANAGDTFQIPAGTLVVTLS